MKAKSPPPPLAGIDQLIPPPRPLGLRSADNVVKDVNVDDLVLGGGEVRVEVFSVDGGRRLLPTPLSVEISVDLINHFKRGILSCSANIALILGRLPIR